jgi:hypothetical protein
VEGLYVLEREMLGADHAEIGALLARRWGLSESMAESIQRHHGPAEGDPNSIVDCVFVAGQATKTFEYGFSGEFTVEPVPEVVQDRFPMEIEEMVASLPHLDEDLDKARIFIHI